MGGILNQIIGAGMGMALGNWNDERQLRQQGRLMNQQIIGQKEMTDYQNKAALQMWKDTNYWAQVEEMKKAGLNPALLYGMGGGGGATAHSASGNVTGGNAPTGGQEVIQGVGMGIQTALMDAQRKNIEADTEQKIAETAKTSGVDTQLGKTQIESLTQGIQNQKAIERLTQIQAEIADIDNWIKNETKQEAINAIGWQAEKILNEMNNLRMEGDITEATLEEKKNIIRTELAAKILQNTLTQTQTQKTIAEINKITIELQQKWKELNIKTFEAEIRANYPSIMSLPGNMYQKLYDTLDKIFGEKTDHTPIKVNK